MTPAPKLRFVERSIQMHPFYKTADGGPAFQTYRVLQQWWDAEGWEHPDYVKQGGEWRDVPLEKEQ